MRWKQLQCPQISGFFLYYKEEFICNVSLTDLIFLVGLLTVFKVVSLSCVSLL